MPSNDAIRWDSNDLLGGLMGRYLVRNHDLRKEHNQSGILPWRNGKRLVFDLVDPMQMLCDMIEVEEC